MLSLKFTLHLLILSCTSGLAARTPTALLETLRETPAKTYSLEEALLSYMAARVRRFHVLAHFHNYTYWRHEFADTQTQLLRHVHNMTYTLHLQHAAERPFRHNLCYVDSLPSFFKIIPLKRLESQYEFYIIILKVATRTTKYLFLVQQMLTILSNRNIINAIVIVPDPLRDGDYLVYTDNIFKAPHCRQTELALINTFRNGEFQFAELLPEKLVNLEQCPLHLAAHNFEPFFSYDPNTQAIAGMEGEMLKVIAQKLNFTLSIGSNDSAVYGEVYSETNSTGGYERLLQKKVDIYVGGKSYVTKRSKYFATSNPYVVADFIVLRLKSNDIDEDLLWPLKSFSVVMWLCVFAALLLGIVLVRVVQLWPKQRYNADLHRCSWLYVLRSALVGLVHVRHLSSPARCGILMWCLGFIILNAAFNARLTVTRNLRPTHTATSIDDLIKAKYTFLLIKSVDESFVRNTLGVSRDYIWQLGYESSVELWNALQNTSGKYATFGSRRNLLYYINSKRLYNKFDILPKPVFSYSICMYFQPNSYLVEPFNEIIQQLHSNGLKVKWLREMEMKFKFLRNQKKHYRKAVGISLEIMYPIFAAMALSYCIALIVFCIELRMARMPWPAIRN